MATTAAQMKQRAKKAPEKDTFKWTGTDKRGRKVSGEMGGANIALIRAQLRRQGINPDKVKKKPKPLFGERKKAITPADVAVFTRQLATMMKAGVPLVQAFEIVADGLDNPSMKTRVMSIKVDVEGGTSFANALKRHPQQFDDLFCSLVDAGEQAGALETMLDRLATYKEKTEALKAKIKKAMTYPIAVLVVAFVVTAILLIKVVPQFESMFTSFGGELPAFTQVVVAMSEWAQEWWFIGLGVIVAAIFSIKQALRRSDKFAYLVDKYLLRAPIVGPIVTNSAIARYCRTLSTTFAAGVPLVEALGSAAGAAGNRLYYDAIKLIQDDVATGQQLQFSMRASGLFPNMVVQMVSIGEESGALDEMLHKAANHYEEAVDNSVDNLTSLMEPMIMSFLGVVIGGLVIAMYLPIFQMGSVV
jgi:type IV pilus assembly protein PilC